MIAMMDPKDDLKAFNKRLAGYRHKYTSYDKNMDLMYDSEGNPTKLRKDINRVLYKIVSGELDGSWFKFIDKEIKNVRIMIARQKSKEKKAENIRSTPVKRKDHFKSIIEQQEDLWKGIQKMQKEQEKKKYKYLNKIGLRPHQLHKLYRKALPYYKDVK